MNTTVTELLDGLTEMDLQDRLANLEGERRAVLTLLRAIRQRNRFRGTRASAVARDESASTEGKEAGQS